MSANKLTVEQKDEIIEKYKTGKYTLSQLGREYGVTYQSIRSMMIHRGIPIRSMSDSRKEYHLNENYFEKIDSEHKAYWLGFLYADGYNSKKGDVINLGLAESDIEILEKFKKDLEYEKPIFINQYKRKDTHQKMAILQICSRKMSSDLTKLGCVNKKSLVLKFPTEEQVPSHLIRHFIRGYNDGDGCISFHIGKTNIYYLSSIIVGTNDFCQILKQKIKDILDINSGVRASKSAILDNKPTREFSINGNIQCLKFLNWLYEDSTIFLARKYKKYKDSEASILLRRASKF